MIETGTVLIGASILIILAIRAAYKRWLDKKYWNSGKCAECGESWEVIETDLKMELSYVCRKCDSYIGINF